MRQAINENRTLQLALLGVLALAGGFLLLKVTKGSGSQSATTTQAASAAGATTAPDSGGVASTPSTGTGTASVSSGSAASGDSAARVVPDMVPGPGLPDGLVAAYRHDKTIALLVRRAGGIEDALVRDSVALLGAAPQVKVYVTKARHIARYSWLTQGVDVSELPALVVLRPRKLSHGVPTASVSYGFRTAEGVVQAVKDALYRGPANRPYHP